MWPVDRSWITLGPETPITVAIQKQLKISKYSLDHFNMTGMSIIVLTSYNLVFCSFRALSWGF